MTQTKYNRKARRRRLPSCAQLPLSTGLDNTLQTVAQRRITKILLHTPVLGRPPPRSLYATTATAANRYDGRPSLGAHTEPITTGGNASIIDAFYLYTHS
uniref:Uncharacterized protein n=1 Tax=Plectus sambesii TaxID=2011161 RepID=A0A914XL58_9BILA